MCCQKILCGHTDEPKCIVYRHILKTVVKVVEEKFKFLCFFSLSALISPKQGLLVFKQKSSKNKLKQINKLWTCSECNKKLSRFYPSVSYMLCSFVSFEISLDLSRRIQTVPFILNLKFHLIQLIRQKR